MEKNKRFYLGALVKVDGQKEGRIVRNMDGGMFIVRVQGEKEFKTLHRKRIELIK